MIPPSPRFAFENYGGSYQLRIRAAEDLAALAHLDEPFWMATSAPVDQLTCDPALLQRLDRNEGGRVQSSEIRAAAGWLLHMLSDREEVTNCSDTLNLEAIDVSHEEGKRLADTARRILHNLGREQDTRLGLTEIRDRQAIFARGSHNGDGVIPPEGVAGADVRALVEDIIATKGAVTDLNGADGVDRELLDAFLADAEALLAWLEQSCDEQNLFPLGADTAAGHELYQKLAPAIDGYFQQCQVMALNDILGWPAEPISCPAGALRDPVQAVDYLAGAPLAKPHAQGSLALHEATNPHYQHALAALDATVLQPLLGADALDGTLREEDWQRVQQAFGPYEQWLEAKTGGQVEILGPEKLRAYTTGDLPARLLTLIQADLNAGPELAALQDLEYLVLLQRWCLDLCNNFVSFPCLFQPEQRAMFEMGRLVMGGSVFNFNLRITGVDKHAAAAERSGIFLIYSRITGEIGQEPAFMVTPVTSGRSEDFAVGKRGVLFEPTGGQRDVQVVKIVENPISVGEAMVAPFKRLGAVASSTAEKITTGAEQQLESRVAAASTSVEAGLKEGLASVDTATPPPAPASARGGGRARDVMLAGGVIAAAFGSVVAALGSAFAFVASKFGGGVGWWHALVMLSVGLMTGLAVILLFTALVAHLKLRKRNLSVVLEASGWAINAPMRLRSGLKRLLVHKPPHPKSFLRLRKDLTRALARAIRSEHS